MRDIRGMTQLCGTGMRAGGIAAIAPPLDPSPGQSADILPGLNPPHAKPIMKLHWPSEISLLHSMSPWDHTPPYPQIACGGPIAKQPAPLCTFPGPCIHGQAAALSSDHLLIAHILHGRHLVMGHWYQPVSLGWITSIFGPKADNSWTHCDL